MPSIKSKAREQNNAEKQSKTNNLINTYCNSMDKKSKTTTLVLEYEPADNGAILADPEMRIVTIAKEGQEAELIGNTFFGEIEEYINNNLSIAVRLTLTIEEIEPKY